MFSWFHVTVGKHLVFVEFPRFLFRRSMTFKRNIYYSVITLYPPPPPPEIKRIIFKYSSKLSVFYHLFLPGREDTDRYFTMSDRELLCLSWSGQGLREQTDRGERKKNGEIGKKGGGVT